MSEHPTTGLPSSDHADAAPLDRRRVLLGAAGAALAGTFVAAGASSPAGAQAPDVDGGTVTAAGQAPKQFSVGYTKRYEPTQLIETFRQLGWRCMGNWGYGAGWPSMLFLFQKMS